MDGVNQEPEDEGDAARAFEALRKEVAALRRGVELIYRQGQEAGPGALIAPDYSPTLGKMEKALQTIAARLATLEGHPAMVLTPASFRSEIDTVARGVVATVSRPVVDVVHDVQSVTRDLQALAGQVREQREQRLWVITGSALGLLGGIALWYIASGLLPRSLGDGLVASLMAGTRWQVGETLMEEASPESFDKMARLYKACGEQPTELCEAAITVRSIPATPDSAKAGSRAIPAFTPMSPGRQIRQRDQ